MLDTLADLADSMNASLTALRFPTHPLDSFPYFIGDGVDTLASRVLPEDSRDETTIKKCVSLMAEEYSKHWADKTKPYPGIPELLDGLDDLGVTKVIFSNKPDDFTQLTVTELLPDWSFQIVRGIKPGVPKKPDPTAAVQIANELKIPASRFLYLGDTNTDMLTANAAGMYAVGALWGFRDAEELNAAGAKVLVEKPEDVLSLF